MGDVENASLELIDRFSHRRFFETIGRIPPESWKRCSAPEKPGEMSTAP